MTLLGEGRRGRPAVTPHPRCANEAMMESRLVSMPYPLRPLSPFRFADRALNTEFESTEGWRRSNLIGSSGATVPAAAIGRFNFQHGGSASVQGGFGADLY